MIEEAHVIDKGSEILILLDYKCEYNEELLIVLPEKGQILPQPELRIDTYLGWNLYYLIEHHQKLRNGYLSPVYAIWPE